LKQLWEDLQTIFIGPKVRPILQINFGTDHTESHWLALEVAGSDIPVIIPDLPGRRVREIIYWDPQTYIRISVTMASGYELELF